MLHLYTRHLAKCAHSGDAHWRRCHCPKWIRGVLLNGTKIRRSTQTGSWEAAEKLARELEAEIDPEREKLKHAASSPCAKQSKHSWAIRRPVA